MSDESGSDAGAAGLALLMGGGIADAMAAVEGTLATVRNAAAQAFAGLSRVQAVGAAMSAVPPAQHAAATAQAQPETPAAIADQARPAERFAPPPASTPAGPERVAEFAPASVPGGGWMAPAPAVAPQAATPAPAPMTVSFASFAPPAPAPTQAANVAGVAPEMARAAASSAAADGPALAVAPVPAVPAQAYAPPPAAAGAATPAQSYAPPAQAGAQGGGPTSGDVYLDGTRVGTWLADHLSREAGRPQAGGTAFDPRLTPAWPGTLQGG